MVVYKITNTINRKSYIGITMDLDQRIKKHRRANTEVGKDIREYGFDVFSVDVLAQVEIPQEARELERFFILEFNTIAPSGYNHSKGGERHKLTEEQRNNLRIAMIGKYAGNKNFFYGKPGTNSGKFGIEHPAFGYKHSEEFKEQKRQAWIGENNPNFGKYGSAHPCSGPKSEEQKKKISEANKKTRPEFAGGNNPSARKVRNVDTGEVFATMKEAAEKYGTSKSKICVVCKGQRKTAGGYHWEYVD